MVTAIPKSQSSQGRLNHESTRTLLRFGRARVNADPAETRLVLKDGKSTSQCGPCGDSDAVKGH